MNFMFHKCSYIPDISNWRINDNLNITNLFKDCKSLRNLPDISNWNIKDIKNTFDMFLGCDLLLESLDISKWNTNSNIYKRFIETKKYNNSKN